MFINPIQRNMSSGEIAAIVSLVSGALTYLGIAFDPSVLTQAVTGIFAAVTLISGIWSWYQHRKNSMAV